jgi:uncharacterized protein DUF955
MTTFNGSYHEIETHELVNHLLRETGQFKRDSIDAAGILNFLGLEYLTFNFDLELPDEAKKTVGSTPPRALLSFADRIVATDSELDPKRTRFSILHEIGHFVLPDHEHTLYVCDERGLSMYARLVLEREASEFAADLLFLGDRFSLEANGRAVNATTVKELATKFDASFEATARRMARKSFKPCMLVVFKTKRNQGGEKLTLSPVWSVRYCVASATFKARYCDRVSGSVPDEIATAITTPGRDITDSIPSEVRIGDKGSGKSSRFTAEFFSNTYNIFCFLKPAD